jgi:hypothetical protein
VSRGGLTPTPVVPLQADRLNLYAELEFCIVSLASTSRPAS